MEKTANAKPFFVPGYIPQFDGLRGVAILLVLIGHSGYLEAMPHAGMLEYTRFGVDLFFVLSGFLITGILLDSKGSEHYFRNFYARRALRIWPVYYAVLLLVFVVAPLFKPAMRVTARSVWPAFVFYAQNIVLVRRSAYPFGLGATWSLAVEEQFYLTWPLLVFLLKKRTLAIVSVSLILTSLSLRLIAYSYNAPSGFVHQFTPARLDAIALGTLAALWLRSPNCTWLRWRAWAYRCLSVGVAGVVAGRMLMHRNSSVVGYTFLAITFAGLLGVALASDVRFSPIGRALSAGWLRYTGKISYGIYLLHYPIFILWARFLANQGFRQAYVIRNLLGFGGQMLLAILAASISWHFFERPILRLKERFPSGSEMHWPAAQDLEPRSHSAVPESRPA